MALTASCSITVSMTGDFSFTQPFAATDNAAGPGIIEKKDLSSGNNTITIPTVGTVTRVTIKPPAANTQALILKGVNGDTGVSMSKTEPTSLALGTSPTIVINAAGSVTGVVLVWT